MDLLNIFNLKRKPKALWHKYYKKSEREIQIPNESIYMMVKKSSLNHQHAIAYTYFGKSVNYRDFFKQIDKCALAFKNQGIRKGDIVTICMPNTPEGIISVFALNKIGAISNMIHPLSSEEEIKNYINSTNSRMLVMIDICYEKIKKIIAETTVYKTIVVSARDSMPFLMGFGYTVTQGYKINRPKNTANYLYWKEFIEMGSKYKDVGNVEVTKDDPAIILHSGGTTGNPKGILLANSNFNALSLQAKIAFRRVEVGDTVLTIMPIFHGFGLGVSVISPLYLGTRLVLMPQFNAKKFDKLIEKTNPNIIMGVPTLYEALANTKNDRLDLTRLKYLISGGDSLSVALSDKINTYLRMHGASIKITQGYGMTEGLAAMSLAFDECEKDGSIGIPLPGNYFKIVTPHTQEEVKQGEDGEICICGPTVMMGYLDNEKETNEMLQVHKDGNVWLHTGDMGCMDSDGVFFYRQRLKRMIISSGYNVYPQHIENIIEEHPAVLKCSVIGIPHPYKVQVAKAYIVLKNDYSPNASIKKSIKEHCEKKLAKYSLPYEYEFRKSLPKTLIGKVDITKLQREHEEKKDDLK